MTRRVAFIAAMLMCVMATGCDGTSNEQRQGDDVDVEWDFTEPMTPTDIGSRSGDVVSENAHPGTSLQVRVTFPNGCVISGAYAGANALRSMVTSASPYIDAVILNNVTQEDDDDFATIAHQARDEFLSYFEVDAEARTELDDYLAAWDAVVADPTKRPLSDHIDRISVGSIGDESIWNGVISYEVGTDSIGTYLDVQFDPTGRTDDPTCRPQIP